MTTKRAAVPYQVAWQWSHDSEDEYPRHDDVEATTAPRAVAKVRKALHEEYSFANKELVVLEVYRI